MNETIHLIHTYQDNLFFGFYNGKHPTIIYEENDDHDFWHNSEVIDDNHREYLGDGYFRETITFFTAHEATICVIGGQWYEIADDDSVMTEIDTPSDINGWFNDRNNWIYSHHELRKVVG